MIRLVSFDLPWAEDSRGHGVAAWLDASGRIRWEDVCHGLQFNAIGQWLAEHVEADATILLDIPIEGCAGLPRGGWRRLDRRMGRLGMGMLPPGNAGDLGMRLANQVRAALPRATVLESHPFSVLKVLWALRIAEVPATEILCGPVREALDGKFRATWPPKYKRETKTEARRAHVERVAALLEEGFSMAPLAGDLRELREEHGGRYSADRLDAILGLVPAILRDKGSAWAYDALDREGGSIVLVADVWWRQAFETAVPKRRRGSKL